MSYDFLIVAAHPDDAEVQMGGTIVKLTQAGYRALIVDDIPTRLAIAHLIREHQPKMVFGTTRACIHPDHSAMDPLVKAAVFYARLMNWDRAPGG